MDKKVTDRCNKTIGLRKRCIRIKLTINSTTKDGIGVSSVGVGGRRRTRRKRKDRGKDPVRHVMKDRGSKRSGMTQ